ncbi:hypothetical protein [Pseudolactococcus paracarnosus]|uniref:Holin n=1 Tax=Pseudolactococcus paracarnosus TaxID=2749962 RepID=A0ABT0AP22_9LACT|nr:hypothetical protein [Lactococcus paracarnosus]MCJ1978311.1 hypothetical protein [Lactococcus paracarnosus]MCJ1984472.1 hypothetical protein [Lactococcus paracarnosus]MCJ1999175.1 hypothetical protein [Lactococcus paracarnosus]
MNIEQIKTGIISLMSIFGTFMIFKHWKEAAFLKIISVIGVGGIAWAMLKGKDIFSIAWNVISAILGVFGVHI